jgi:hypothetical protein
MTLFKNRIKLLKLISSFETTTFKIGMGDIVVVLCCCTAFSSDLVICQLKLISIPFWREDCACYKNVKTTNTKFYSFEKIKQINAFRLQPLKNNNK